MICSDEVVRGKRGSLSQVLIAMRSEYRRLVKRTRGRCVDDINIQLSSSSMGLYTIVIQRGIPLGMSLVFRIGFGCSDEARLGNWVAFLNRSTTPEMVFWEGVRWRVWIEAATL